MRCVLIFAMSSVLCLPVVSGCKTASQQAQEQRQAALEADARAERERLERYKVAIEKALREDELTGHEPTAGHTKAMRTVDMAECPPEFREAYMKHIHAWEEAVAVREAKAKLDEQSLGDVFGGGLCELMGADCHPIQDHVEADQKLKEYAAAATGDVRSSFQDVETIASKYGATMPKVAE